MVEFRSEDIHVSVLGPPNAATAELLTDDALRFVGLLCSKFDDRRRALLAARKVRAKELDAGEGLHFIADPNHPARDPNWRCAPVPEEIKDRRVEITGPVDRKMVINGLNSGACVYMADFEDSTSPTWKNVTEGQLNLRDAVRGTISFTNPSTGKVYALQPKTAVLFVRPRGWHLDEAHVLVNGQVASGSIFDFALYLFHNHEALRAKGKGIYYYLPKLESHLEAALWNDVFVTAQQYLGLPVGTLRATVLLETIPASFEMEEILYQLKDHSLGLNCGRWDYLFSYIKKFKHHPDKITPDRSFLTMTTPLMEAYVKRLIYICHKRGTFAMGGMSAAIPIKNDRAANDIAMKNVQEDKLREVKAGHDGTWVAHPALVQVARRVFDQNMPSQNQINSNPGYAGSSVTEQDLLRLPVIPRDKAITSKFLAHGVGIVLAYTEAWLRGVGCIPLHNAMEDAATAEISRAQIWQWRRQGVATADDGQVITSARIADLVHREVERRCAGAALPGKWRLAGQLVEEMLNKDELDDFLTSVCYPYIVSTHEATASTSRL
jgi:malate synthase